MDTRPTNAVEAEAAQHRRNRRLTIGLAAAVAAVIIGLLVTGFWRQSQNATEQANLRSAAETEAARAERQAEIAQDKADKAATAQAEAEAEAVRAEQEKQRADQQTQAAIAAQQTAEAERAEAVRQAEIAVSRLLAAQSAVELNKNNPELALLLSLEALSTTETLEAFEAVYNARANNHARRTFYGHTDRVLQASWSQNESRVLTRSDDGTARIWDAESGAELVRLVGRHTDVVRQASWSQDESRVLTCSDDGTARIWDAESGAELVRLVGHTGGVGASWSQDESRVLTSSEDGTVRIWDAESGVELVRLAGHTTGWVSASWSQDESRVLTRGYDGTARIWDVKSRAELVRLVGHTRWVSQASWSQDGSRVLTSSEDGTAGIWDAESGADLVRLVGGGCQASWSQDESRVLTSNIYDGTVRIWDAESGAELVRLAGHTKGVSQASWSQDESRVLTGSRDGTVRIWDAESGAELVRLEGHTGWINQASWSQDGSRVLTSSADGTARIWDVESGAELVRLEGHTDEVLQASWSQDGSRVLTGSADGTARIWDAESGAELVRLVGHTGWVGASWSQDESRVLTTSNRDGTVRIWDAESGAELVRLAGHTKGVSVSWSQDGSRVLVVDSKAGIVRIWAVDSLLLKETTCQQTPRNMTWEEWRLNMAGPYRPTCSNAPIPPDAIEGIVENEVKPRAEQGQFEAAAARLTELLGWLAENHQYNIFGAPLAEKLEALRERGAPPSPPDQVSGSLDLTQTTSLTPTQIPPLDPNGQNIELVGHFSATVKSFSVQQDYAYLAADKEGLQIVDISDPTAPTLVGAYEIRGALVRAAVSGTVAVALDNAGKILLFDVSTPTAPVEWGQYTLPEPGNQVVIAGDYAYIPAGDSGLHIIDISTPGTPTEVGVYQTKGAAHVAVAGDYAYLSANDLLHIINISNPGAPTAIRSYRPLGGGGARALVIEDDRLYLTIQVVIGPSNARTYIKIFDLSDPTVPIPIESELPLDALEVGYSPNLAVKDDKIYIPSGLRMIDVSDPSRPIETGFYRQGGDTIIAANDYVYLADSEKGLYIFKPQPVDIPQPSLNVDLIGHFGGASNTVLVQGDYAYVGFGPEMAILDVSNPTAPRRIGYLVLPGQDENEVNAITVVGSYAYVADDNDLWVVDVSEPTTPFVVGYMSCQYGVITDVSVGGQYAYLTIYSSGGRGSSAYGRGYFKVVDVSDPAHLFEVSTFETSKGGSSDRGARAVQVIDNTAYVADSQEYGLRLFDISNPAEPVEVRNSRGLLADRAEDFVLRDTYAYLTNGSWGGFQVIEVSPATLKSIGVYETPGDTGAVALSDNYAYFAEDASLVDSKPVSDYGLRILDISKPINPTAAGFYTTTAHITDLTIKDDYAYFTMQGSLHVLDLSNPTHPVEIVAYQTPPSASKISVDDNHAYVVVTGHWWEDKELQMIDISNPVEPVTIERAATDLGPTTPVVNGYAYSIDNGDLRILDVSNPATLTQVGVYPTSSAIVNEIVTRGNFAYLTIRRHSLNNWQLAVLDLSNPTRPRQVDSYILSPGQDTLDLPSPDLALIDDYLYLFSADAGLRIFDISEPSQLVEVKIDQGITGEHLALGNGYAYVVGRGLQSLGISDPATPVLQILDISDPANPVMVGTTKMGLFGIRWSIWEIAVDDNYAYLIDDVVGLRVIDISNPTAPIEVGFSPISGIPADLAVTDDHIWVATEESGLFPFQLTPADETSPSPNILQPLPPTTPAAVLTPTVSAAP